MAVNMVMTCRTFGYQSRFYESRRFPITGPENLAVVYFEFGICRDAAADYDMLRHGNVAILATGYSHKCEIERDMVKFIVKKHVPNSGRGKVIDFARAG